MPIFRKMRSIQGTRSSVFLIEDFLSGSVRVSFQRKKYFSPVPPRAHHLLIHIDLQKKYGKPVRGRAKNGFHFGRGNKARTALLPVVVVVVVVSGCCTFWKLYSRSLHRIVIHCRPDRRSIHSRFAAKFLLNSEYHFMHLAIISFLQLSKSLLHCPDYFLPCSKSHAIMPTLRKMLYRLVPSFASHSNGAPHGRSAEKLCTGAPVHMPDLCE